MDVNRNRIDELLSHPSEGLNVEIKNWINPADPEGEAKTVRAVLGLRNRNGGYLIIGFEHKSLLPHEENRPSNVGAIYTVDVIQGLISKYASEPFEISVAFGKRDTQEYPVVVVPEGVRSPVAAKADLFAGQKRLIQVGDVYFRTLNANELTPSDVKHFSSGPAT